MARPSLRRFARRVIRAAVRPVVGDVAGRRAEVAEEAASLRTEVELLERRVEELATLVGEVGDALKERNAP